MRSYWSVVASFVAVPVAVVALVSGCSGAPGESTESSSSALAMSTATATTATAATDDPPPPPPACNVAPGNQIIVDPSPGCQPYGDWSQGEFCVSGGPPNALHWENGLGCAPGSPAYDYCLAHYGVPTVVNEVCVHVAQSCGGREGSIIIPVPAPPCSGGAQACSCCTCGSCHNNNN